MRVLSLLRRKWRAAAPILAIAGLVAAVVAPVQVARAAAPQLVQAQDNTISSGTKVQRTFTSSTTAGNLIAVYVVWSNTNSVSVTDNRGNTYTAAGIGVTPWNNNKWGAQVFYAKNVAGGSTTVTATFSKSISSFGLLYMHEYSGINKVNPLDVSVVGKGSSGPLNSGNATTSNANDLLFGAGASVGNVTTPGAGYTVRNMNYGNMTEDKYVTTTGSYNATATQYNANGWVMQMVAFRADAPADTTPPSVPNNLSANSVSTTQINLAWTASTDNIGVTGYRVYRNGLPVSTTSGTSYQDTGLSPSTTYTYTVEAFDAAGNTSAQSTSATATTDTPVPDTEAPSVPTNLTATPVSGTQVNLTWTASTDNIGVTGYRISRDGTVVGNVSSTSFSDQNLTPATTYTYTVAATDAAANVSAESASASATTTSQATPYVQPGTVGYLGSTSDLTVIDSTHPYPGAGGSTWVAGEGSRFDQANLTLDHVWVKGSMTWSGTGTLTITNSIIEGGSGWYAVYSTASSPVTILVSDSTLKWPNGQTYPSGYDEAPMYFNSRAYLQMYRNDISGFPQGVNVAADNSVINSNWIHDLAYNSSDPHLDGIFIFGGTNIRITGNYVNLNGHLHNSANQNDISMYATASLFFQNTFGWGISSTVVKDNYFKGGGGSYKQEAGTNVDVENNIMDRGYCGPAFSSDSLCDDVEFVGGTIATWANNKHSDGTVISRP